MEVIESIIKPTRLNPIIDKIISSYIFADFNDKESCRVNLLVDITSWEDEKTKSDLEDGLILLKKYKYIDYFNSARHIRNNSFKEKDQAIFILDSLIKHFPNCSNKTVPFVVYFGNKDKWNFLKDIKIHDTVGISFSKDKKDKIDKFIGLFEVDNKHILKTINKLSVEYSKYFPARENLNKYSLRDFLYFFAHSFTKEFKALKLFDKNVFDRDNYSYLKVRFGVIKDNYGNLVIPLNAFEKKLVSALNHIGISKANLMEQTELKEDAFEKALKEFKKKLKSLGIDKDIRVVYTRREKVYNLFVKGS